MHFHIHKFGMWELIVDVGMNHLMKIVSELVLQSLVYVTNDSITDKKQYGIASSLVLVNSRLWRGE